MSVEAPEVEEQPDLSVQSGSLKEKLAARRAQLQSERTHVFPIPGYEDLIAARYKSLDYKALRKIGNRNAKLEGTSDGELANYADTLINACVELLRVDGDDPEKYPSLRDSGNVARWDDQTVREFFDPDLPTGTSARQAILAAIPGTQLALHFQRYDEWLSDVVPEIQEQMRGESEPSQEG